MRLTEYYPAFFRVADPHHFHADPDPAFHCNADPDLDPPFHFNADPNPDPELHQSERICNHWSAYALHGSIQPLTILNFDFNADPDPAFHSNAGPDPDPAYRNNADPDPQPRLFKHSLFSPWVGKTLIWHIFFLLPTPELFLSRYNPTTNIATLVLHMTSLDNLGLN